MDEAVIRECSSVLRALTQDKPWMTARGLARRINTATGYDYPKSLIENTLIKHSQLPQRIIRYSYYPSKRTLDILWGHVEVVGEKQKLAELHRIDEPDPEQPSNVSENASWFFLSHNHRDFGAALHLRDILSRHGFGAWLFETDIPQGGQITPLVQKAIEKCSFFLSYVTRRSIGSLWMQKEIEVARRTNHCETHVVIDGKDKELLGVFEAWTGGWPPEREKTKGFCRMAAKQIRQSPGFPWVERCLTFMDSLHEYVGNTNRVLTYPALPKSMEWQGNRLQVQPFEEFVTTVAKRDSA